MKYSVLIKNMTALKLRNFRWIDIIGISIFFVILATSFFFFLRSAQYVTLHMRVTESSSWNTWDRPPTWYVELLRPGIEEKDGLGRSTVKLQRVYRYRTNDDNHALYVDLQVRAVYNKRTNQYTYNGSPLLVGSYQIFKLQGMLLSGIIHSIGTGEYPRQVYQIEGYLDSRSNDLPLHIQSSMMTYTGIPAVLARQVAAGLTMKDIDGRAIATIAAVRRKPAVKLIPNNAGTEVPHPDPEREQLELTAQVEASMIDGVPYFRGDTRMLIGSLVRLDFEQFGVFLTITSLKKME